MFWLGLLDDKSTAAEVSRQFFSALFAGKYHKRNKDNVVSAHISSALVDNELHLTRQCIHLVAGCLICYTVNVRIIARGSYLIF